MSRQHFRFCSVATPDDWLEIQSLGAMEPDDQPGRLSVVVRELWPRPEVPLEEMAAQYKVQLEAAYAELEMVDEGPVELPQVGQAYRFVYKHEEGESRQNTELIIPRGPLACHLTMSGPKTPDDRRERLFEEIASTFQLERNEVIAGARQADLLGQARDGAALSDTSVRTDVAKACVSVPLPAGWQVAVETNEGVDDQSDVEAEAMLFARGAEILIQRPLDAESDPEAWLNRRMAEMQSEEGVQVIGWQSGEIHEGRPFAALSYSQRRQQSRWGAPELNSHLTFATGDTMLLVWTLNVGSDGWHPGAAAVLAKLLQEFTFLDTQVWETVPIEPWLDLELRGPWVSEGPGIYVKEEAGNRLIMQLSSQEVTKKLKLAQVRPDMEEVIDTFRNDSPVLSVFSEDEAEGMWRGVEAFRYSLDAEFRDQGVIGVRAVTALVEKTLYTCLLYGTDREEVHDQFLEALDSLDIAGMTVT